MKKQIFLLIILTFTVLFSMEAQRNFRGQRKSFSDEELTLENYFGQETSEGVQITLTFSEPVNPQSLTSRNVQINGKSLSSSVRITFNREGTTARFTVNESLPLTIQLSNIKSFDGKTMSPETVIIN